MATGFAGGVGGSQSELCGALAGGIMIIGALFGRTTVVDDSVVQRLTTRFRERFADAFAETQCARVREEVGAPKSDAPTSCADVVGQTTMVLLMVLSEAGVQLQAPGEG
jgi:C_GCAxxG_C_C family probable redox protein